MITSFTLWYNFTIHPDITDTDLDVFWEIHLMQNYERKDNID